MELEQIVHWITLILVALGAVARFVQVESSIRERAKDIAVLQERMAAHSATDKGIISAINELRVTLEGRLTRMETLIENGGK